jgi:hypothetical protein
MPSKISERKAATKPTMNQILVLPSKASNRRNGDIKKRNRTRPLGINVRLILPPAFCLLPPSILQRYF